MRTVEQIKEANDKMLEKWVEPAWHGMTHLPIACLPELHLDRMVLVKEVRRLEAELEEIRCQPKKGVVQYLLNIIKRK